MAKKRSDSRVRTLVRPQQERRTTRKVGRPSRYRPEYVRTVYRLALLGLTNAQMAAVIGVARETLEAWGREHPELLGAIRAGKADADARVAQSLYQRALGYTRGGKHYPADTQAASLWLRNRQPQLWRDRIEHGGTDGGPIEHAHEIRLAQPSVDAVARAVRARMMAGESAMAAQIAAPAVADEADEVPQLAALGD